MARWPTLVALLLLGTSATAETLQIDAGGANSTVPRPSRGMSMASVEAAYGTPANRRVAVGEPPITRWEYPTFTVYFEHNFVIHSVVNR